MKYKITSFDTKKNEVIHDYSNIYEVEETANSERIKIGLSTDQVGLLISLLKSLNPPFFLLYVLVVNRQGNALGRYQPPLLETREEVIDFLLDFKEYLETDGRCHLWIGTLDNNGTLVFDQHNVVYAYGPEKYEKKLKKLNFSKEEFNFPSPHCHHYYDTNDEYEKQILNYWEWELFPLADGDEYIDK